jgi:hypothetical protein
MNFITLSKLRTKLLAAHHLIITLRIKFDTVWKPSKFLLEIRTLVSSVNNNVSNTVLCVLTGRYFMNIMNNICPGIDPLRTPSFKVPQSQKLCCAVLRDFT